MVRTIASLALLAAYAAPALAQHDAWVHLSVRDARREGAEVRINLPAPVVVRAVPLLPDTGEEGYRLVVGDQSISARDLTSILAALRGAPEGTATRRDTGELLVDATHEGQNVRLVVEEKFGRNTVAATIPLAVADALAGEGRRLDIARAVRQLAAAGGGELALIAADRSRIRIWVDRTPSQASE